MTAPSFDPTHAVRFDLPRGSVRAGGEGVLLVPTAALDDLVLSAPAEAIEALGRALGAAIGRRAAARMNPSTAAIEAFVTHLAGEAAIAGVGALSVERWGRALVVVVEDSPLVGTLLSPLVAAAVEAASGRPVACTLLSRDERSARILVGSERGVGRVREWVAAGVPWGEAIARLHGGVT
ncbi:MAG TPA: hypothetical protein VIF15_18740 [Polyangiaceae bacterium]|jgi:hypothetical protein